MTIGFSRARLNGEIILLDDDIQIKKNEIYNFEIVIDRLLIKDGITKRITDSIEHALKLGNGVIGIIVDEDEYRQYSEKNMSPVTGEVFPDLEPRLFSFNSPLELAEHVTD